MNNPLTFVNDGNIERLDVKYYHSPKVDEFLEKCYKNKVELIELGHYINKLRRYPSFYGIPYLPEGVPCLKGEAISEDGYILKNKLSFIPRIIHKKFPETILKEDDLVFSVRGTIGKIAVVEKEYEGSNVSANLIRIELNKELTNPYFIRKFLSSEYGIAEIEQVLSGALQFTITTTDILNIKIPNLEKAKQDLIMEKIKEYEDKSKENYEKYMKELKSFNTVIEKYIPQKLPKRISDSFFKIENFDNDRIDALSHSPNLRLIKKEIKRNDFRLLEDNIDLLSLKSPPLSDSYNLVELEDIDENFGKIRKSKEVLELKSSKTVLKKGEMVIPKLEPEKRKIALVNEDNLIGSSELMRIKIDERDLLKDFVWIILRSDYIIGQWKYLLTGSSRMRITRDILNETLIPYVPKNIQQKIISEIKELYNNAERYYKDYLYNKNKSNEIFLQELLKD